MSAHLLCVLVIAALVLWIAGALIAAIRHERRLHRNRQFVAARQRAAEQRMHHLVQDTVGRMFEAARDTSVRRYDQ